MKIRISIIMFVYKVEDYLTDAIESILNQDYENIEFIIVNDGSTDASLEMMKKGNRIILIDQENKGLTKFLNIIVDMSKGDYIARQDADDISMPNRLSKFIAYIEENGKVGLYSTPAYVIDEENNIQKIIPNYFRRNGFDQKLLNYYNSMIHGTLIIRSDIIKGHKYNENFRLSQYFELYHRLMKHGFKMSYDNTNISYKLRIHSNAILSTSKPAQINLFKTIFDVNGIKYHIPTLKNKTYFKIIDLPSYIKKKIGR